MLDGIGKDTKKILSKNSTLISRKKCRFFFWGEKLVKMLWFWTV